jgi:Ca-activated chloride channel family protein
MLSQQNGKATVATLSLLLAGSSLGALPVGRFVGPRAQDPAPAPQPLGPIPHPVSMPPTPIVHRNTGPKGKATAGPLTLEGLLSQSKVCVSENGSLFLDARVTADAEPETDKSPLRPIDFALVLDVSGSMADDNKIGLMRKACLDLGSKLGPRDRVAIVSFSTTSQVLFPLQSLDPANGPTGRAAYESAIEGLIARGGTNISAGLELGAAALRSAAAQGARRILLLTDGRPNMGDATPEGLRRVCERYQDQGISVTTVGLGLDYNGKLLSSMAESGGGSYHYVDTPDRIAGIYEAELRSLRSLVARNVKLVIRTTGPCRLESVVEWRAETASGGETTIALGDLDAGRSTKVVSALGVAIKECEGEWSSDRSTALVSILVRGEDARTGKVFETAPLTLGAVLTASSAEARASRVEDATKDVENAQVSGLIERARERSEQGDVTGAKVALEELRRKRAAVSYEAADGRRSTMNVDALEQALQGGSPEDRARALLFSRSAASSAAR